MDELTVGDIINFLIEDDDIDDVVSSIYGFMKVDGAEAVQDEVAKDVINLNIFGEVIAY